MSSFNLTLPVAIGCDHAGFEYKTAIVKWLNEKGYQVTDMGVYENKSVDYPDYAHPVSDAVEKGEVAFGILICGSANGVAITANKHQGIRAGLAFETEVAKLIRQHNDANVICIPARFVALDYAINMVSLFIETPFEGGRHQTRVNKIACS
ncbi:ribose 5-phosphate isomerase B [Pseudobacter ginsenosidimutans]|jgi:ribose 5-phosphate isomerase B|uniref:Ribose 5-phosphate isomerase B n=1 Tax=Pseudobacter ginsenosidimutans TaxID=661488 RepID=A0A4Q7MU07_9BACT|nr:ribose 5-phosphate isomerase B [Pseudobacter ginsenosidimutans]QEC41192.1 ribose 5-phosphate isomerase B [Pseudobacter ginsenosidimutans]RZS72038.1 ribose 5-phosphate isomerase B [Pseudobacter ginsenosidimutans]